MYAEQRHVGRNHENGPFHKTVGLLLRSPKWPLPLSAEARDHEADGPSTRRHQGRADVGPQVGA